MTLWRRLKKSPPLVFIEQFRLSVPRGLRPYSAAAKRGLDSAVPCRGRREIPEQVGDDGGFPNGSGMTGFPVKPGMTGSQDGDDLLEPDFWLRLFLFLFYAGGEVCYSQVQIIDVLSDIF